MFALCAVVGHWLSAEWNSDCPHTNERLRITIVKYDAAARHYQPMMYTVCIAPSPCERNELCVAAVGARVRHVYHRQG